LYKGRNQPPRANTGSAFYASDQKRKNVSSHDKGWCVLTRKENVTSQQKFRLRDLFRYNLQTVRTYLLREKFQQFWEYNSPRWAGNPFPRTEHMAVGWLPT
jgi:hypothetical protein